MKRRQDSMEERINFRLIFIGLFSMALTAVLSLYVFYRAFDQQVSQDLATAAQTIARSYQYLESPEELSAFGSENLRLTLISPEGDVLYESSASGPMENHLSRPEIQDALSQGQGSARRQSATLGYNTYYEAVLLSDGNVLRIARDVGGAYALYDAALPALVVCCFLILVTSVLLAIFLTRQLVRPILKMGEYLEHLPEKVPYRELEPFAAALRADRLLRQNNEKLRQEFTANVSHELKTPLTSISGYAELMENGMAKPQDIPAFAAKIRVEAGRMLSLVADIIQLSALDNQDSQPAELEKADLYQIAKGCVDSLRVNAQKAFVGLRLEGESTPVQGIPHLLEELCVNLCDNAIRYNRPGGLVRVSVGRTSEGSPYLQVEDNGIGIPPASQSRVFERFYRVDKSRSKATGGTGLGLAIVKHIALLHHASIKLESQEGRGTCITVVFPEGGANK